MPIRPRLAVIGTAITALVLLYGVSDAVGTLQPAISADLYSASTRVLAIVNVTVILLCVAALAVIAVVRKLHYGIGAVLACTIGATITGHAVPALARTDVTAAMPNGSIIAVASCAAAAIMVAPPHMRWGVAILGIAASSIVTAAAAATGAASAVGVLGALLVTALWWAGASIVMLFSPIAAEREAQNPLDTAALAMHKRMELPLDRPRPQPRSRRP